MSDAKTVAADVFSALGAVGNFILFLSQVPLMRTMMRERDSTMYSYLPSVTMGATLSLWSAYTVFVIPTPQLLAANFSGVVMALVYIGFFLYFSKSWLAQGRIVAVTLGAFGLAWGVALGILMGGVRNGGNVVGWITAAVNVLFFISPLKRLYEALRDLDVTRVPLALTYVQLVQPAVWVIAAALLGDAFILGVNAIGLTFAWLQFAVIRYIMCARAARDRKPTAACDADGAARDGAVADDARVADDAHVAVVVAAAVVDVTVGANSSMKCGDGADNGATPDGNAPLVAARDNDDDSQALHNDHATAGSARVLVPLQSLDASQRDSADRGGGVVPQASAADTDSPAALQRTAAAEDAIATSAI